VELRVFVLIFDLQDFNTTIAMTTNHFSGGTVLSQNTMIPSPVKTSNVILIPKVSAGKDSHQIVTLNNETLQAYIKILLAVFVAIVTAA
jgi:hypothetical protein